MCWLAGWTRRSRSSPTPCGCSRRTRISGGSSRSGRGWRPRAGGEAGPAGCDITADRAAAKPLTFGAGIHYCLGANLARAELQEALAFLPARMPGLELDGEPELGSVHGIYGLGSLPIRWTSA